MKKIIGIIQPFMAIQQIYVYEDGNKLDAAAVELNKVKNVVLAIAEKFEITDIDLKGPSKFLEGIKADILKEELAKYGANKININII